MVSGIIIDTKHGEKFAILNHSALPLAGSRIGYYRVHDMFSRIFATRICEFSHQYLLVEKKNIFLVVVFSALNSWVNQNSYYIIFGQKKLVNSFSENSLKHVMSLTNIMKVDIYHVVKGHWAWTMCEWTIFIILTEN